MTEVQKAEKAAFIAGAIKGVSGREDIPFDVINYIAGLVDFSDILNLAKTCKTVLNAAITTASERVMAVSTPTTHPAVKRRLPVAQTPIGANHPSSSAVDIDTNEAARFAYYFPDSAQKSQGFTGQTSTRPALYWQNRVAPSTQQQPTPSLPQPRTSQHFSPSRE